MNIKIIIINKLIINEYIIRLVIYTLGFGNGRGGLLLVLGEGYLLPDPLKSCSDDVLKSFVVGGVCKGEHKSTLGGKVSFETFGLGRIAGGLVLLSIVVAFSLPVLLTYEGLRLLGDVFVAVV